MSRASLLTALVLGLAVHTGCATKKYVRKDSEVTNRRIDAVEQSVEANETRIRQNEAAIASNRDENQRTRHDVDDVRTEAVEAKRLAKGKLLYEVTLTNDDIRFSSDEAQLTDAGIERLRNFVDRLKVENRNVFVEIEGHTDNTGEESYNQELGRLRAEAVQRYLADSGIPLHRIGVISYGETRPIADNESADGRAKNRRVVLLVRE